MEITRYYAQEAGRGLGERVFDAAFAALDPIQRMPSTGSPRLGLLCDIPGLRSWGVPGFPLQWFCFERPDHLDVVRLLSHRQDILAIMEDGDGKT